MESLSGSVVVISRRARCRVHVGRGWVHVRVVTVASDARGAIRGRTGFGSQIVFVGGGVFVWMMVQGVWGLWVSFQA